MYSNNIRVTEFFKWCIENKILDYIEANYKIIENDMNLRNSYISKKFFTKLEHINNIIRK